MLLALAVPLCAAGPSWEELDREVYRLYERQEYAEAVQAAQRALKIAESSPDPGDPRAARSLLILARCSVMLRRFPEAEDFATRALPAAQEVGDRVLETMALGLLGDVYEQQGQLRRAELFIERTASAAEKYGGRESQIATSSLLPLALLYFRQGRYKEAEAVYQQVHEVAERRFGPHSSLALDAAQEVALVYEAQGRLAEAEFLLRRHLETVGKNNGLDHPFIAKVCGDLGRVCLKQGRFAEAAVFYGRAMEVAKKNNLSAAAAEYQAALHEMDGRPAEAEDLYRWLMALQEQVFGLEHYSSLDVVESYGRFLRNQGRVKEADEVDLLIRRIHAS